MLALSNVSMPLHDPREEAGLRVGISFAPAKVCNFRRRCEAYTVRRGNQNAGESVPRKVSHYSNIFPKKYYHFLYPIPLDKTKRKHERSKNVWKFILILRN